MKREKRGFLDLGDGETIAFIVDCSTTKRHDSLAGACDLKIFAPCGQRLSTGQYVWKEDWKDERKVFERRVKALRGLIDTYETMGNAMFEEFEATSSKPPTDNP